MMLLLLLLLLLLLTTTTAAAAATITIDGHKMSYFRGNLPLPGKFRDINADYDPAPYLHISLITIP
jgi:hypothetical protein